MQNSWKAKDIVKPKWEAPALLVVLEKVEEGERKEEIG